MADTTTVQIGENSPEFVAYRLLSHIASAEKMPLHSANRQWILDTYTECLMAVRQPGDRAPNYKR
jgi:hypothetical protein